MIGIGRAEYCERLDRLATLVRTADLERFLVTAPESIYYLTGVPFEPLERPFFLLVGGGVVELLVPKLEERHMRAACGVTAIHTYPEYPAPAGKGWADRLRSLLGPKGRLGVEPHLRRDISDELGDLETVCVPLVERLRVVKSPPEVAMVRRAARFADDGVGELLNASYSGATVAEGFARTGAVTRRIIREVPDWEPLTTKVVMATWSAPGSAEPHSVPGLTDELGEGPHVALVLTRVNGYCAESERTYFTVPPPPEVRRAFRAMEEARRVAFGMLQPGAHCGEIDAAVTAFLNREGYSGSDRRLHRTGHGIGIAHHEAPALADGSGEVLEPGMVVSIEPGIYLEGVGGFRHSDTVLVTESSYELLTLAPASLEELNVGGPRLRARLRGFAVRRALRLSGK